MYVTTMFRCFDDPGSEETNSFIGNILGNMLSCFLAKIEMKRWETLSNLYDEYKAADNSWLV